MKKRVLVIGAAGMAGHVIVSYLMRQSSYHIITIARENPLVVPDYKMDVTRFDDLSNVIQSTQPDYIINCIGILNRFSVDSYQYRLCFFREEGWLFGG